MATAAQKDILARLDEIIRRIPSEHIDPLWRSYFKPGAIGVAIFYAGLTAIDDPTIAPRVQIQIRPDGIVLTLWSGHGDPIFHKFLTYDDGYM